MYRLCLNGIIPAAVFCIHAAFSDNQMPFQFHGCHRVMFPIDSIDQQIYCESSHLHFRQGNRGKHRFHIQSTAQLNYLLSTIVYVPDSKFTYNAANALLYSQRISRDFSPPEIATSAPSENALWVFRMRINASCF